MRHYFNLWILAVVVIGALYAPALSQKSKKYPVRTLAELESLNREGTDQTLGKAKLEERQDFIGIDPMNSIVRLQFIEGPRTISETHRTLFNLWGRLKKIDKKFLQSYTDEFLLKENDVEYWIPVQAKDKDAISAKFQSGDTITLNVLYVGARKEKNERTINSLFVATSFEQ